MDLILFDRFVLDVLCTLYAENGKNGKIFFSLKEICRKLNLVENGKSIKKVSQSIQALRGALLDIHDYVIEDGSSVHKSFGFIVDYHIKEERTGNKKESYAILNKSVVENINQKRMKILKQPISFNKPIALGLYCYLDTISCKRQKKKITLNLDTLLVGLVLQDEIRKAESNKKLENIIYKIKNSIEELKKEKYIKDCKIAGREKTKQYTFYFN